MAKLWVMFYDYIYDANYMNVYMNWREDKWLSIFDQFIKYSIVNGYVVETMAVNPQIRSVVKNYGSELIIREFNRRQTDRQTDTESTVTDDFLGEE